MSNKPKNYEPPETMYPENTSNLKFRLHPTIWQAAIPKGAIIFFEAETAEKAWQFAYLVLGRGMQYRRLPITELQEK